MNESLDTEISHHLVVLMLQNMTVPHIFASTDLKWEILALVVTNLHACDCHLTSWYQNHIHK